MLSRTLQTALMLHACALLFACGGGGGEAPRTPTAHQVTLDWTANREADVNAAGGGYLVNISGLPAIDVPYPGAPTLTVSLMSGSYSATVTAYSATDPNTGLSAGGAINRNRPALVLSINVP